MAPNRHRWLECVVCAVTLTALTTLVSAKQQFPKDPLKLLTYGKHVVGEFMEPRDPNEGIDTLHTGIDIACAAGTAVYPPIPAGVQCWLVVANEDLHYVILEANDKQDAQFAFFLAGHIDPTVRGHHYITADSMIGTVQHISGPHLHAEAWLCPSEPEGDQKPQRWAVNPRGNAFKDVTDWTADAVDPTISNVLLFDLGQNLLWEVTAYDRVDADASWLNGIKSLELCINNFPVNGFTFEKKSDFTLSDFYYCGDCYPNGSSAIVYKLISTKPTRDFVYVVTAKDGKGNKVDTGSVRVTVAEAADVTGEVQGAQIQLRWRIKRTANLIHFDVLEGNGAQAPFIQVNEVPIVVVDGATDYEFTKALPSDWETVRYRVMATNDRGDSFMIGQREFDSPPSLVSGVRIFPNPSMGAFRIQLQMKRADLVRVEIFESSGRLVRTLCDGRLRAGRTAFDWDGKDGAGHPAVAGVHYARIQTGSSGERYFHKLVVLH
jgi:hypothetical protein